MAISDWDRLVWGLLLVMSVYLIVVFIPDTVCAFFNRRPTPQMSRDHWRLIPLCSVAY